jgi:NADH:ubiquinone oxidoreductase subunit E
MVVSVCIGSACHLKGSYEIINELQRLVSEHGLGEQVEIKAVFCLQECGKGVSVKVDEGSVHFLTRNNVREFFASQVLTVLNEK